MNGRLAVAAAVLVQAFAASAETHLQIDMEALAELLPLAAEAIEIHIRAGEREAAHAAELAKKGVAEVPPSGSQRYVIDTSILPDFAFDARGELYIDRRFVTDEELETVHAIERWIAKWFPSQTKNKTKPRKSSGASGLPVFRGFEDDRYQQHDKLIAKLVAEFNRDKAKGCGGTASQAAAVPDLSSALVKAHMIEESGGNGTRSKAAWAVDPLQVHVPGDWGDEKELVGLSRPQKRNEGSAAQNIRAAGDAAATARRLKECRLGFVAFDASETLPEAAERLFITVCDRAREGFDVVVLAPPGKPSPLRTVRAADITLYDALGLLCDAADCRFEIKGDWVVISPRR